MIKKRSIAILIVFTFLISVFPVFAEAGGVENFKSRRANANLILTWTNPAQFKENILYVEKNGSVEKNVNLGNAKQYVYTPVSNGDSFVFTIKTIFDDESVAEESLKYFARYNDTESIKGWTVQVSDTPDFGTTSEDSADGLFSAYFNCREQSEDTIYKMYRYGIVEKDKKYKIGFWFKTVGYESGASFGYDDAETGTQKKILIGDEYSNGKWYYFEQEFTAASAGTKPASVYINSKGKIYIDKFTFEEIDGKGNTVKVLFDDTFEEDLSVGNLAAKKSGSNVELTWTNPAAAGFSHNEIYKIYNDKETLETELKNGETSYTASINAGGGYKFKVKSCYENGAYGEKTVEVFKHVTDTTTIPGWTLDIYDENTYKFRGDYGVTNKEAYDGIYSAYFNFTHNIESYVYILLTRDVSLKAEKKYCFSYWFKTEDYNEENSRIMIYDFAINNRQKILVGNDEYPDGEWHNVKYYYDSKSDAVKRIQIWFDSFGTLYLDNLEVYEVDENNQKIGKNLITGNDNRTNGSFEFEKFSQKPEKVQNALLAPLFRGFDISWETKGGSADKVRIYNGNDMLSECAYSDGKVTIENLSYGEYNLDLCTVSSYGVESDKVSLSGKTLSYKVSSPEFSKKSIAKGNISATVKAANDGEDSLSVALITVLYNGNKLEKINFEKAILNAGEEKDLSAAIDVPELQNKNYSIAAYVWDDFFAASKAYGKIQWLK